MTAKQIVEFLELVQTRCAFSLTNGFHLEAYILGIEAENIVFACGGPLSSGENELVPIERIDLGTLCFWSDENRCYLDAKWDAAQNK